MITDFYYDREKNTARKNQKTKPHPKSVAVLIKEGLKHDAYLKGVGWKHDGLVRVAEDNGVKMDYQKKFLKTSHEKRKGLTFIECNLLNKKPVIVSVFRSFNPKNGGHLVVVNGIKQNGASTVGYFIQDPDHRFRGNNYFVSKNEFLKGWRGGMIYLK